MRWKLKILQTEEINEEINDLIVNRHVARRGCFDNVLFHQKNQRRLSPILRYSMSVQAAGKT